MSLTLQEEAMSMTSPSVQNGGINGYRTDGKKLFKPAQQPYSKGGSNGIF